MSRSSKTFTIKLWNMTLEGGPWVDEFREGKWQISKGSRRHLASGMKISSIFWISWCTTENKDHFRLFLCRLMLYTKYSSHDVFSPIDGLYAFNNKLEALSPKSWGKKRRYQIDPKIVGIHKKQSSNFEKMRSERSKRKMTPHVPPKLTGYSICCWVEIKTGQGKEGEEPQKINGMGGPGKGNFVLKNNPPPQESHTTNFL